MAYTLAIGNQKGGVGKTTTCFSLGACLAERGRRILVVDLDPQANLTLAAGRDFDHLDVTLVDVLDSKAGTGCSCREAILHTSMQGLDILPADPRMARLERDLYELHGYEDQLSRALNQVSGEYDYILLDCPPTLSSLTILAFSAADGALIPVQCEYYAAKGLNFLLTILKAVEERTGRKIDWNLAATLYDPRNKIHRTVFEQLQSSFPEHIFETVIRLDTHLRECPIFGEPIIIYAPRTRASLQYRALAVEFEARRKER